MEGQTHGAATVRKQNTILVKISVVLNVSDNHLSGLGSFVDKTKHNLWSRWFHLNDCYMPRHCTWCQANCPPLCGSLAMSLELRMYTSWSPEFFNFDMNTVGQLLFLILLFSHFQNLFLRIFTFLNRNFNKLSTTEIATLVWRQQTSSPMLGEVETGRLKCLVSGYQKSLIDPMQCTGVMKLSF